MEERERLSKLSPEIYVYATNKHFINLYDALRISKIKLEIAGYDPATNRQTGHASAWIDLDDARLLSHLVCHRLFTPVTGGKWERYGGSQRDDATIESRTISIEWDPGDEGRFSRFPYRLTVANGPGRKTETGGVSPAGEPTSRLSTRLPEADMIKLMLALGDYIHAYEAAHHHRLVAQRLQDLRAKLADRAQGNGSGRGDSRAASEVPASSGARPATSGAIPPSTRPSLTAMPGGNSEAARANRAGSRRAG
jgi:hypothetical protein